jgi:transcriptional regulator
MHPSAAFRPADDALVETLLDGDAFAMIFASTPNGPRVAHAPLLRTGPATFRFHLARGNALSRHLGGAIVLAVVNGPDAYVSPRWYADPAQVPTWNYLAVELEGPVRQLAADELPALLDALSDRHEARIAEGQPWTMAKMPEASLGALLAAIVGFELTVSAQRTTIKLSQNKRGDERERVAAGIAGSARRGAGAEIAALMRELPQ